MKLTSLFLTALLSVTFLSSCQFDVINSSSNDSGYSTTSEDVYESTLGRVEEVKGIKNISIYDSGRSIFAEYGSPMFAGTGYKDDNILYANMTYYFVINLFNEKGKSISVDSNYISVEYDSNYLNIYPDIDFLNSPPARTRDDYTSKNGFFVETKLPIDSIKVTFNVNNHSKDIEVKILEVPEEIYVNRFALALKKTIKSDYSVPTYKKITNYDEFEEFAPAFNLAEFRDNFSTFNFEKNFLLMLFLEDGTYIDYQLDFAFIDYNNDLCLEFLGEYFDASWEDGRTPPTWGINRGNFKIYMLEIDKQFYSYSIHIRCSFYKNIDVNIYY